MAPSLGRYSPCLRLFFLINLLFLSTAIFSQQSGRMNIIGDFMGVDEPHIYQLQAGAFLDAQNAHSAFERLKRVLLNPVLEQYGPFTRVVINGVQAADVPFYIAWIESADFYEVIIRFDPEYELLLLAAASAAVPEETVLETAMPETATAVTVVPETVVPEAAVAVVPETVPRAAMPETATVEPETVSRAAVPETAVAVPENKTVDTTVKSTVEQGTGNSGTTNVIIVVVPPAAPVVTQPESVPTSEKTVEKTSANTDEEAGKRVGIGLGLEINLNSGSDFGVSVIAAFDFNFSDYWAAGLTVKGSHDFSSAWVVESGGFLRRYIPGDPTQLKEKHSGFFFQADVGFHLIAEDNVFMNEGDRLLRFTAGVRSGYRFLPGQAGRFYIEPFVRVGYPFLWGAGLLGGIRF